MDYYNQSVAFNIQQLLYVGVLAGVGLFALYFLWSWCNDRNDNSDTQSRDSGGGKGRLSMKTVYAHEIEPGLVVVQSEDGEYFKILKEFDLTTNTYGSLSCTRSGNSKSQTGKQNKSEALKTNQNMTGDHFQTSDRNQLDGLNVNHNTAVRQFQGAGPSAPLIFDADTTSLSEGSSTVFGDSTRSSYGGTSDRNDPFLYK